MLFKDKLSELGNNLAPEFDKLIHSAFAKQSHPGDLLLWYNNGFYDESVLNWDFKDGKKYNPHLVGLGEIGLSEQAHYKFIHQYRQVYLSKISFEEYQKQLIYSVERSEEIKTLTEFEETTINLELLIYLKFWEADNIIKKFYELIRIVNSEPYDWYFKVAESNRDKEATGTRQDILLKLIRDKIEDTYPVIFAAFKKAYKTQIRNAIAHSKYSFQGRNIHLHNYIKNDPHSQLRNIAFDEWIDIFHLTIVIHNEYIRLNNFVNEYYCEVAGKQGNVLNIQVTELSKKTYELPLLCRQEYKDWGYKQN